MVERLLQLDDVRHIETPEKIAILFHKLGYHAIARQLAVDDLELPVKSAEAIWNAYLIADQGKGALQVLLFQLQAGEFSSPSIASSRMRSIAQSLGRRPSNFLLLGTKDYNQLMLVNPRKSFDAQMNLRTSIRKLLIDRNNPTNYDRDRLEEIAARDHNPQELYQAQCDAFDVEKLTKQFYIGYEKLFDSAQRVIQQHNPHPYFNDPSRLHQFTQRLLGRIMFLYFLQKKEFLGGKRNFLTKQYKELQRTTEPDGSEFYSQMLEPLFFETLNKQRLNNHSPWGPIPYLNGGLFDCDYGPGVKDAAGRNTPESIQLPNSLFDRGSTNGILGFFNGYNFTVAENVQGDEDVAVDPEMLGKVFENLLAKEERGQSGTFYTPRRIVHFMCVEVLSRYLADHSGMSPDAIKQLVDLDPDLPNTNFNQLLSKEQARKLKQALENVKCLDPAVGSAAFLLGMMQIILTVRQAIARREGMTVQRGSLTMSQWKRDIIANNLYGVDIKPEAIEIAKLRMWLSLVVDIPNIENVEALPNLDYKLMCGDSLISTIHGEQLIPDPTNTQQQILLAVTPIQQAIQPLLKLQRQYYNAQSEERRELRERIIEAEANVFRAAVADRHRYWETEQRNLQQDIRRLGGRASRIQSTKQQMIAGKLAELDQFAVEVESGDRSLGFFQYHLHFNDVFQEKGGFDIVIGNPPYVRSERLDEEYKESLAAEFPRLFRGTADIYTYFYGRGMDLLRSRGYLSFISSNKFMRAGYGNKLRGLLSSQTTVHVVIDFGDLPVFDATAYPMILILQKQYPSEESVATAMVAAEEEDITEIAIQIQAKGFDLSQKHLTSESWALGNPATLSLLEKLKSVGSPLREYIRGSIYRGVTTGFNDAFIIDSKTRSILILEDPKSEEIIKPYLRGRDIKRWSFEWHNLYLIFTRRGTDIKRYPAIKRYLNQFRERLTPGTQNGRKPGPYEWYEIQDSTAYFEEFQKPKIIFPDIAREPGFTFDTMGTYLDATAFLISLDNLCLLGILNSQTILYFYTAITSQVRGGYLRYKRQYIEQIPIPNISGNDRKVISILVQKCLDAKGQGGVSEWEAEINDRVAHLYGLTAQEMAQITGL